MISSVTIHVSMMISYIRWEKLRDCEMSNVRQSRRRMQTKCRDLEE